LWQQDGFVLPDPRKTEKPELPKPKINFENNENRSGNISDPEPPRLKFKIKTAREQVEDILRKNGKPDAKETPFPDRCAKKLTELKTLSSQQNVTKLVSLHIPTLHYLNFYLYYL
jgi:hypothetical protein